MLQASWWDIDHMGGFDKLTVITETLQIVLEVFKYPVRHQYLNTEKTTGIFIILCVKKKEKKRKDLSAQSTTVQAEGQFLSCGTKKVSKHVVFVLIQVARNL